MLHFLTYLGDSMCFSYSPYQEQSLLWYLKLKDYLLSWIQLYYVAGTEQVVLGDLVYCKENPSEKVVEIVGLDSSDDCGDSYDTNNEDEVTGDIHDNKNSTVKVSLFIFAYYRIL